MRTGQPIGATRAALVKDDPYGLLSGCSMVLTSSNNDGQWLTTEASSRGYALIILGYLGGGCPSNTIASNIASRKRSFLIL